MRRNVEPGLVTVSHSEILVLIDPVLYLVGSFVVEGIKIEKPGITSAPLLNLSSSAAHYYTVLSVFFQVAFHASRLLTVCYVGS